MNELSEKEAGHMITRRAGAETLAEQHIPRISLDEIAGDFATVSEICAWTGAGANTVYEWCRSGFLKDDVVHLGDRLIRVRKTALARLIGGEQ